MSKKQKTNISADQASQDAYAEGMEKEGFTYDLMVAGAFVRGIRDLGYKSTATALDELIDNSIQGEAKNVGIAFGFGPTSDAKPTQIAVFDDGHGMSKAMLRLAVIWGGTHRENDRTGMGRYGYGLPSASVSQGKRFTVYSCDVGGAWHAVTIDVDEISRGDYTQNGRVVVPEGKPAILPDWLAARIREQAPDGIRHGTVVLIDKLDRLDWVTASKLKEKLVEHIGVVYRNYLTRVKIRVEGTEVEPCDPLFITPGFRYYDLDDDRAEALPPQVIEIKNEERKSIAGTVRVRYSYMPPLFQIDASQKDAALKSLREGVRENNKQARGLRGFTNNARFGVMKEHNGIVVLREGRQIDVIRSCDWRVFQNNDRNWKVEIDFSAGLDEEFSVTTSKQQIRISERIWNKLAEHGVKAQLAAFAKRREDDVAALRNSQETDENQKRASESAMEDASRFKPRRPDGDATEREAKAKQAFDSEAESRAKKSGVPKAEVIEHLKLETAAHPYRVKSRGMSPLGPFFEVTQVGAQRVLTLNNQHLFFSKVYAGPDSTPRLRAAIESLLWVLGECELDATGERQQFYTTERGEWSRNLNTVLNSLEKYISTDEVQAHDDSGEDVAS